MGALTIDLTVKMACILMRSESKAEVLQSFYTIFFTLYYLPTVYYIVTQYDYNRVVIGKRVFNESIQDMLVTVSRK